MDAPTLPAASDNAALDALRREPVFQEMGLAIGGVLGVGGTAVVYRARDTKHARDVAVKILHREQDSPTAEARFAQEIRVAAGLRHPNVLPLFDSGSLADGRLFSVMPVAEGRPLSALIGEGPLAVADAVRLARETGEALAYLHERGYVHRDVKPENILVEAGHAVLTDFGLAASAPTARNLLTARPPSASAAGDMADSPPLPDRVPSAEGSVRLTMAGTALGTLPYMSPEALLGETTLDTRADTYALGVVLYEMLTGELPFTAATPMELLAKRTRAPWPSVRVASAEVSSALDAIIAQATALDPAARFPSAGAMVAALAGIRLIDASRLLDKRRGRRQFVRGIALAVVVILAVVMWLDIRQAEWLDPNRIVVADLMNDTSDPAAGGIGALAGDVITEALTAGTKFEVVNATVTLPSRLQRLVRVADTTLTLRTRRLVNETRAGLVVTGAYFRSGGMNEFVAEVTEARSGSVLGVAGPVRAPVGAPDRALHTLADSVVAILARRHAPLG